LPWTCHVCRLRQIGKGGGGAHPSRQPPRRTRGRFRLDLGRDVGCLAELRQTPRPRTRTRLTAFARGRPCRAVTGTSATAGARAMPSTTRGGCRGDPRAESRPSPRRPCPSGS
jgi:hypothetical protein